MRALVLLAALASCDKKQTASPTVPAPAKALPTAPAAGHDAAIAVFWRWFAQNAASLRADKDFVAVMNKISDEMAKIEPGLIGEIFVEKEQRTLVISADGKKQLFPQVRALYAARPSVAGWKIVAFRQRTPLDELRGMKFEMQGKSYDATAIRFVAERNGDQLDLALFSPTEDVSDAAKTMMFVMLDHTIGEYDSETRIQGIDFAPASAAPKTARPLPSLVQLLDAK